MTAKSNVANKVEEETKQLPANHIWKTKMLAHGTTQYVFRVVSDEKTGGGHYLPKLRIKVDYLKKDGSIKVSYADIQNREVILALREMCDEILEIEATYFTRSPSGSGSVRVPDELVKAVPS